MYHDFNIQDWQLGTDGVRAGVAATDARLDGMLLDAALSDCIPPASGHLFGLQDKKAQR